jgi:hypothetical protein
MAMSDQLTTTRGLTLRVRQELFDRLDAYAVAQGRSVNGAANYLLDAALRDERRKALKLNPPTP